MAFRKLLRPLIIALAICLSNLGTATSQSDESALRELMDKYFTAYAKKDLGALVRLWSDKSPDLAARFQEIEQLFTGEDRTLANLSVSQINIREDRAVLRVDTDVSIVSAGTKQPRAERLARGFALIKEGGEWKVWRDAPATVDLSAFLNKGDEWKIKRDAELIERFAATLVNAKTDEEWTTLLDGNRQLVTAELIQVLIRQAARHQAAGNYSAQLSVYRVARAAAEKAGDKEGAAISEAGLGDALRNLGRSAEAREHYQTALALFESLGDKLQAAAALENIGLIYLSQNDYAKALESYQKVLALAESFKDRGAIASALEAIASVYYEQSSYAQSLEFFDRALKLHEMAGKKAEIAAALNNIGNAYYQQENYAAAIEYYRKAIEGFEATGDKQALAGAMNNIGGAHYSQGNYDTALEFYAKSLKIAVELNDKQLQATSLLGTGVVYYAQRNYSPALEYFQKNLALTESMRNKSGAARTLHNIGLVHYHQQNYNLALENYAKSLRLYEELNDRREAPIMLGLIGGVYFAQADYGAALESYRNALSRFEELKHTESIAGMLASIASVHYAQGSYDAALENYQKSLAQYEALESKERVADTLEKIGSVYYSRGEYERSLEIAGRAAALAKQAEYLDTLWRARLTAGAAYRALGQAAKAQQSFEEATAAIESMRDRIVGGEQARQQFYKDKKLPYLALMELMFAQNKTSEAFIYAERVKANLLSDVVQSGGVRITKSMTATEQEQERKLENAVISLKAQADREKQRKQPDQKRLTALGEQLKKALGDYRSFEMKLYAAHPQLKTFRGESDPLKLEEASGLVTGNDDALLEYVITEGRVYLFVLAHEQRPVRLSAPAPVLMAYVLNLSGKDLAARVMKFREMIARRDEGSQLLGRELFDLLLKPARDLLKNKTAWTIVPDSVLWQMPFQALQVEDDLYVVERHAISYAASLTALQELRKSSARLKAGRAASSTLLAFANPVISKQRAERIKLASVEEKLEQSPETENEADALRQLYSPRASKFYVGAQAREESAKQQASAFRILHFAAPATLNDVSPMYSHIALADPYEKLKDDGLLEAWEIMRLSLRAELAILSASDTIKGREESGYGVTGMSWAFFVAGCPATIVSERKVADPSTTELMTEFHRRLRSSKSTARALQQATLKLVENSRYSHPFYWSAFAVVGDGR